MFTNKENKTEDNPTTKHVVGKVLVKKTFANSKAGFTLFVALIVSSLLLSIGLSLSNIILKQLLFSGSGRESQIAFYAADSGAECALYWDVKNAGGVTTFDGPFSKDTPLVHEELGFDIRCGTTGEPTELGKVGSFYKELDNPIGQPWSPATTTTTFHVDFTPDSGEQTDPSCAIVRVIKSYVPDPDYPGGVEEAPILERTRIESRGYNTLYSSGECQLNNPKIVERAVVLTY